jgi:hypothetical protein
MEQNLVSSTRFFEVIAKSLAAYRKQAKLFRLLAQPTIDLLIMKVQGFKEVCPCRIQFKAQSHILRPQDRKTPKSWLELSQRG